MGFVIAHCEMFLIQLTTQIMCLLVYLICSMVHPLGCFLAACEYDGKLRIPVSLLTAVIDVGGTTNHNMVINYHQFSMDVNKLSHWLLIQYAMGPKSVKLNIILRHNTISFFQFGHPGKQRVWRLAYCIVLPVHCQLQGHWTFLCQLALHSW